MRTSLRIIPGRALRIALLWHSANSGNLGVGALTVANIELLRQAADRAGVEVEFVIVGWFDAGASYPQVAGIPVVPLSGKALIDPRRYARAINRCDLVIDIGGGDSFADIYGSRRLIYMLATKGIAIALRKPLVLAPQTIGPFASKTARRLASAMIAASSRTFARDQVSADLIDSRSAQRKVTVTTDVAFALPHEPAEPVVGAVRFGFGVSALLYHGGYTRDDQFGLALDYERFVHDVIAHFAERSDVELVLIPHVIAPDMPVEDDLALCRRLAVEAGLVEPPHFHDPVEAKSFISGCDIVAASRMHACIAALSSGVATIPIAYSRKFEGLFGSLGYAHTVDATTTSTDDAIRLVLDGFDRRHELTVDAKASAANARERLGAYVDWLTETISDGSRGQHAA